ncbi:MAG: UDP-3-O-acyl-N-acetylglucosamine deacetylase [Vampirovibrio sp.]|nr:UDP-3-O-acyl-N-acetylglucosamine deacetylase [Vampirovibrio sp.]
METTEAPSGKKTTVSGKGLITGLPVTVEIEAAPIGHGIVFYLDGELPIPARLETVVNTERGVTLGHPSGKFLAIVEHFLSACAMAEASDLKVSVNGAPELPLLDGSAIEWIKHLNTGLPDCMIKPKPELELAQPVHYVHNDTTLLYALPSNRLQVTYAVDFDHPDLRQRWIRWDSAKDTVEDIAKAQTFGFVRELPTLQAMGLAKGVDEHNTLGLTDDGGYTRPLRMEDEPIRHKILDLWGDLMLTGLNPLHIKAHIFAFNAGHASHTGFAKKLLSAVQIN